MLLKKIQEWTVINKMMFVLILGIIVASGLILEKHFTTNTLIQSGPFIFSKNIKIESDVTNDPFRYDLYLEYTGNIIPYIDRTERKFDYLQLDAAWNSKNRQEQGDWIKQHFSIDYFGDNIYGVALIFKDNDYKDFDYIKENGEQILNSYIEYLGSIRQDDNIEILSGNTIEPQTTYISPKRILIKYGIIGFMLGVFLAFLVLIVVSSRKED